MLFMSLAKIHFADMLSRSPLKIINSLDTQMHEMVHTVSKYLPMSSDKKDFFRRESSRNETLTKIIDFYYNGWPNENKLSNCVQTVF